MLIACTSDIHVDISEKNRDAVQVLVGILGELDPDVFVFAGDVSPYMADIEEFFQALKVLQMAKVFVSGNHDIWISKDGLQKGFNSHVKYYCSIRKLCEKYGIGYLAEKPIVISDIGFVGTIGWFDYSTRNPSFDRMFSNRDYERNRSMYGIWNDGEYAYWSKETKTDTKLSINWGHVARMTDRDVSRMFCNDLRVQLKEIEGKVKQAVAVTHMVPFKELVVYKGDPSFDFFSAFIGCVDMGETILSSKHVTHCVCGHTHFPADQDLHSVKCICSPIGYMDNYEGDLREYIATRTKTFKL